MLIPFFLSLRCGLLYPAAEPGGVCCVKYQHCATHSSSGLELAVFGVHVQLYMESKKTKKQKNLKTKPSQEKQIIWLIQ